MGTTDGDERFDIILERWVASCWCSDGHEHTSTHVGPPLPCSGDSTHLKLHHGGGRCESELARSEGEGSALLHTSTEAAVSDVYRGYNILEKAV